MEISGYTKMAAVVARPIQHSLSPFIHNAAFQKTKTDAVYLAWEVSDEDLPAMINNVKKLNMLGLNLSMPFKQAAMPYLDDLTQEAKLIGAINTVAYKEGKLIGHNTDGAGFFKALEQHDFSIANQSIVILGGGGAAIAIMAQASLLGASKITVFARRSPSFEPLEERIAQLSALTGKKIDLFELPSVDRDTQDPAVVHFQEAVSQTNLLVNATSVGMDGVSLPLTNKIKLNRKTIVVDVIYKVMETPFLEWAAAQGNQTYNGLGMLLYQAAESFKLWTGKTMPCEEIKNELKKKLELL